ncbi:MAG: RDD family protein [Bacteroidia bacterium]
MDTIIIPTAQNIELEYPVASLGDRILAAILDLLIVIGYVTITSGMLNLYDFWDFVRGDWSPEVIAGMLPAMLYTLLSETFMNGQTLGKKALKIQVLRMDGSRPTLSEYVVRWLIRLVDIWSLFGIVSIITIAVNRKGQRLGDIASGTTVVKLKLVTVFGDTMFVATDEEYSIRYPQIRQLSDRDMSILKEVLDAGLRSNNPELLMRLASKVREVAKINEDRNMSDYNFLSTVLADYNHLYKGAK